MLQYFLPYFPTLSNSFMASAVLGPSLGWFRISLEFLSREIFLKFCVYGKNELEEFSFFWFKMLLKISLALLAS